jgi:hypothetical protein
MRQVSFKAIFKATISGAAPIGLLLTVSKPIYRAIDMLGNMQFVSDSWPSIKAFFDSGTGTLTSVVLGATIVGYSILQGLRQQPITEPVAPKTVQPLLKQKSVYAGSSSHGTLPTFSAKFAASGGPLTIYVDEIHHVPAMASILWTARRRLRLKELLRFSRDEAISVPLVSQFERDNQKWWRWGQNGMPNGGYLYIPNAHYKARIVVEVNDREEHCYFIAHGFEGDVAAPFPRIIGEHMFNFHTEWEAENA